MISVVRIKCFIASLFFVLLQLAILWGVIDLFASSVLEFVFVIMRLTAFASVVLLAACTACLAVTNSFGDATGGVIVACHCQMIVLLALLCGVGYSSCLLMACIAALDSVSAAFMML
jgi:hypothetical protein